MLGAWKIALIKIGLRAMVSSGNAEYDVGDLPGNFV